MSIQKLEHVGIMARNMEESVAFYEDVLQMVVIKEIRDHNPSLHLVFLGYPDSSQTLVELVGLEERPEHETGIVHHLAFTVDDIDAEVNRLRSLNVRFIDPSVQQLPDGTRYIFLHGPNREHLELFQPPSP